MIVGRPPKLSRRDRDRLVFLYTVGTSKRQLSKLFNLGHRTVSAYIRGEHKNPGLSEVTR